MPSLDETTQDPGSVHAERARAPAQVLALVIAWSRSEPHRVGEVALLPGGARGGTLVVGRGPRRDDDPHPRVAWIRQRPGENTPRPPLASLALSRVQLLVEARAEGVRMRNVGRRELSIDGATISEGLLRDGGSATIEDELVLLLVKRPVAMPPARAWPSSIRFGFGQPDPFGIVGESPAAWALRDELAFVAARDLHVLLHGATGTGKELAARAIHGLGRSAGREMIARNAATLPAGIADAELFGNAKDYPNPGMRERPGLVGAADGSTLFLDELGELSEETQARLLRVLDRGGEYQRLGEERTRRSAFRLIGATNRPTERLKHDLLARLTLRVELPPLERRVEDVPLLAQHLLRTAAAEDAALAAEFVERDPDRARDEQVVRVAPELVEALLETRFEHGVRQLRALLWRCIQKSTGAWIALAPDVERELASEGEPAVDAGAIDPADIRRALDGSDGNVARAYRMLGLKNRHVLVRLMKKHGIERSR